VGCAPPSLCLNNDPSWDKQPWGNHCSGPQSARSVWEPEVVVVGAHVLCSPGTPGSAAEQLNPGQLLRELVQARQSLLTQALCCLKQPKLLQDYKEQDNSVCAALHPYRAGLGVSAPYQASSTTWTKHLQVVGSWLCLTGGHRQVRHPQAILNPAFFSVLCSPKMGNCLKLKKEFFCPDQHRTKFLLN